MEFRSTTYIYLFLGRIINAGGGLISIFLLMKFFSAVETGYYYTFLSLIGFQVFFELGLSTIVVQKTSSMMTELSLKKFHLIGDKKLLANYFVHYLVIFSMLSVAMLVVFILVGWQMLAKISTHVEFDSIFMSWVLCAVFCAFGMLLAYFMNFAEGLGQIHEVAKIRMLQGGLSLGALWLGIVGHLDIKALILQLFVGVFLGAYLLGSRYWKVFEVLWSEGSTRGIGKRITTEWPLQWRLTLSFLGNYFNNQIYVLSCSLSGDLKLAGKVGIALQVVNSINGFAITPVNAKLAIFSRLYSLGDFLRFRAEIKRAFHVSLALLLFLIFSAWIGFFLGDELRLINSSKFVTIQSSIVLTACIVFNHAYMALNVSVQSRGKDPFYTVSILKLILVTSFLIASQGSVSQFSVITAYAVVSITGLMFSLWIYVLAGYQNEN